MNLKAVFVFLFFMMVSAVASAQDVQDFKETRAKILSIFLYNFARYIEWPGAYEVDNFQITVLNPDQAMEARLTDLGEKKQINGRTIEYNAISQCADLKEPNIFFVPDEQGGKIPAAKNVVDGRPILLVSQSEGGLEKGSDINFTVSEGRYRFEIYKSQIVDRGLKVSSSLTGLAERVKE